MKKNALTLIVFLLIGLFTGMILSQLLSPYRFFSFLTQSAQISWEPKADFGAIQYDLFFQVKLNIITILSVIAAIWIYRKM